MKFIISGMSACSKSVDLKNKRCSRKSHTYVTIYLSHSSTPKILSVCAFHWIMARKERVDVAITLPDASPEYILSLSPEVESALIGEECKRSRCCGVGGATDIVRSVATNRIHKVVAKYDQMLWTCRAHLSHTSTKMHSIVSRINNVSAFMSSCMMALLAAITLTTFLFNPNLQGDLTISSIKVSVRSRSELQDFF